MNLSFDIIFAGREKVLAGVIREEQPIFFNADHPLDPILEIAILVCSRDSGRLGVGRVTIRNQQTIGMMKRSTIDADEGLPVCSLNLLVNNRTRRQ